MQLLLVINIDITFFCKSKYNFLNIKILIFRSVLFYICKFYVFLNNKI